MNKVLLYTSIFGPYDDLNEILTQTVAHDAICYTDQDFRPVTWGVAKRELKFDHDTMLTSRYYKINAEVPGYEFCVYLDGSFEITGTRFLEFILDNLTGHELVFFKHPWRDCIYDEADVCLINAKYNRHDLRKQVNRYVNDLMPTHYGLWACGCFAFRNNQSVSSFRNRWWQELSASSAMDQISLPYVVRERQFEQNLKTIDQDIYDNQYLKYTGHKTEYVARQGQRMLREGYLGGW